MSDAELISKLRNAAHDRCKAMRPAGYPGGVEDLFEYRAAERIAELGAAICKHSHNKSWIGQTGAPGWCLGCDKHRSLIRESNDD